MKIKIDLVKGVEGNSLYLDVYRIAGPKPCGVGKVLQSWSVDADKIKASLIRAEKKRRS